MVPICRANCHRYLQRSSFRRVASRAMMKACSIHQNRCFLLEIYLSDLNAENAEIYKIIPYWYQTRRIFRGEWGDAHIDKQRGRERKCEMARGASRNMRGECPYCVRPNRTCARVCVCVYVVNEAPYSWRTTGTGKFNLQGPVRLSPQIWSLFRVICCLLWSFLPRRRAERRMQTLLRV